MDSNTTGMTDTRIPPIRAAVDIRAASRFSPHHRPDLSGARAYQLEGGQFAAARRGDGHDLVGDSEEEGRKPMVVAMAPVYQHGLTVVIQL
jgi:hypothetical protein